MKNKLILAVSIFLVFGYVFTYVLVRKNNTVITEMDGCPIDGCNYVYFEQGSFTLIYTPIIILDKRINHAEFIFTTWKK